MNVKEFVEIIIVFLLSSVKFGMAGVPSAVFAKWSFFKVLTVTISGGVAGTFFFVNLSDYLLRYYKKIRLNQRKNVAIKRKFTPLNKLIVKVKHRFGLRGLVILAPSILSIPLGVFLAVRYFHDKRKIMRFMFLSISAWAVVLYFFYNNLYHVMRLLHQ